MPEIFQRKSNKLKATYPRRRRPGVQICHEVFKNEHQASGETEACFPAVRTSPVRGAWEDPTPLFQNYLDNGLRKRQNCVRQIVTQLQAFFSVPPGSYFAVRVDDNWP
jgi:hypothetical protein